MIGSPLIHKRNLHVSRLLAGIHLAGGYDMIQIQLPFTIGSNNTDFVHPLFRCPLHITFITYPRCTPTSEVDSERERSAFLSVL